MVSQDSTFIEEEEKKVDNDARAVKKSQGKKMSPLEMDKQECM